MLPNSPSKITLLGVTNSDGSFTGVTTGTSIPVPSAGYDETALYFESVGTTSGGTLLIEEASRADYSGTWSQVASVSASSFTGTVAIAYHIGPNAFAFLRVRISSDITGGGKVLVFMNRQGS